MKKLLIYISRSGTVEKCVHKIVNEIKEIDVVNLSKQSDVAIEDYDVILIGTSIRMGLFNRKIKQFINKNKDILLTKKMAYFICCGFNENWRQYYEQNMSKDLLEQSVIYTSFGGEMNIDKQPFFDKFIVKMINKSEEGKNIKILNNKITEFIEKIDNIKDN